MKTDEYYDYQQDYGAGAWARAINKIYFASTPKTNKGFFAEKK